LLPWAALTVIIFFAVPAVMRHSTATGRDIGSAADIQEPDSPVAHAGIAASSSAHESALLEKPAVTHDPGAIDASEEEPKAMTESPGLPAGEGGKILVGKLRTKDESEANLKGRIRVDLGRLREAPSLKSKTRQLLPKGTSLSIVLEDGDWCYVKLPDDKAGWIHRSLL